MRQVSEEDLNLIFSHTLSSLQQMKGQNVFITGGTGFFGKWLLEVFIHANQNYNLGIELYVLSRNPSRFIESYPHLGNRLFIHFVEGDLESFSFPAINCSYIIHAATDVSTSLHGISSTNISESILAGTKRILEFAKVTQAKKILLTSSGAVYGTQKTVEGLSESDVCLPNNEYGVGKLNSENYAIEFEQETGIEVKIARCFAFIGAYLPLEGKFAAGNFINSVLKNKDIVINGDGTPLRSYLYCADLMIWLLKILTDGESSTPYNVGSDHSISIEGVANQISSFSDRSNVEILQQKTPEAFASRYIPSIDKGRDDLKLEVYTDFHSAISKTINSFKGSHAKRS